MAQTLSFSITSPVANTVVGRRIAVAGVARRVGVGFPILRVGGVRLVFGSDGPEENAQLANGVWNVVGSPAAGVAGGATVTLTAIVSGIRQNNEGTEEEPDPGEDIPFEQSLTVAVVLDGTVPDVLTIDPFTSPVTIPPGEEHVLDLSGSAGDAQTGITAVQLRVDGGPFAAVAEFSAGTGVRRWRQPGVKLRPGAHQFTVRATDGADNRRTVTADLFVRVPFEPGAREQVFSPTRYLLDLAVFARRYVTVAGAAEVLTPAMLADRFHQPFDRLTDPVLFERATAPVGQARVAVEVLRARLGGPAPPELDQRFRRRAYEGFLGAIGTSADELRRAKTAPAAVRAALAERIGIGATDARPDRLDALTLAPETITDAALEELFGYRTTAPADPLGPTPTAAQVLLWQRDALREGWRRADEIQRDAATGALPIIDPDMVGEHQIRTPQPGDPAFDLWAARQAFLDATLAQIATDGVSMAPLERLDHLVTTHIGPIDVAALAAQDADGHDVRAVLDPLELRLDAFRFLARLRAPLADGVPVDPDWDDVVAILVGVQKRRQFRAWRLDERRVGLVLEPASFLPDAARPETLPRWRVERITVLGWRTTLSSRAGAATALESAFGGAVAVVEASVLPGLRDALINLLAAGGERPDAAAERLSRELVIDLRAERGLTTRADQALETLRGVLFSTRAGRLAVAAPDWTIEIRQSDDRRFDREWEWMGAMGTWLAAGQVFAYPENQLFAALYPGTGNAPPTAAYRAFITAVRGVVRLTPESARDLAATYVAALRAAGIVPAGFVLTDQLSDAELAGDLDPGRPSLRTKSRQMFVDTVPHREIFWLVPMALAGALQAAGQFQAALDWYRTVYAYHLPAASRRIYFGLTVEDGLTSSYDRVPEWLIKELNPHVFALQRRNCYTRATIMTIAGCFQAFADAEFARSTAEGNARARTLYETAADLLDLPEAAPEDGDDVPFPPNPVWATLREQVRSGLDKIHRGLNIAGEARPDAADESVLPSQYRYSVLVERAKSLVGIAQQVEAAYLAALEQRDAKTYDELRAGHDLELARATVAIQEVKLADADTGIRLAELQRDRARLQEDHFEQLLEEGYSGWEQAGLAAMGAAAAFQVASAVAFGGGAIVNTVKSVLSFGLFGDPGSSFGQMLSAAAGAASTGGQIALTVASFERREQDWQLSRGLARTDVAIGDEQVAHSVNQHELALREREVAALQQNHAESVATFLATRFTNAELFDWMSGVLGRVYAFFLQQATALARLAEAQLAFERQELPVGFIGSDYWRDAADAAGGPDRRGLTGSVRLLEDVSRLDQYAFDTDRRKLHLVQTFSMSDVAALELQRLREIGVLTVATPQLWFDREFPGHYLRLIRRVRVSLIALVPPVRGIRATLAASGVSRAVVARGPFDTVGLRRPPESIALTSATSATGLFELEPESGLLLPFEGMGVDTVWRLELPKAANPFDYRTIGDVLLTIEYTALDSPDYRERVVRELDQLLSADRSFSIRNQFPDIWYELANAESVAEEQRMRARLTLTADDYPPHLLGLAVEQLSLLVSRADELADELTVTLTHTVDGRSVTAEAVPTTGGIISTRRPSAAPWLVHVGANPTGEWELQFADDDAVRSWFRDGLIDDIVFVMTVLGTTPPWPS